MSPTSTTWYGISFSIPWAVHSVITPQDAINVAVVGFG